MSERRRIPDDSVEINGVLTLAEREARRLGAGDIHPEHLLSALAGYERGRAFSLLESHGVTADRVRRQHVLSEPTILVDLDDDAVLAWLGIDLGAVRDVLRRELGVDAFDPAPEVSLPGGLSWEAAAIIGAANELTDRLNLQRPPGSLHLLAALLLHRLGSRSALLMETLGVDVRRMRGDTLRVLGVTGEGIEALDSGRFPDEEPNRVPRFAELPTQSSLRPEAARLHELDPDTPRAVRSARILYSLAVAVEQAAAARARKRGWTEEDIDRILHRAHVDEYQAAIRLAFTRALAADDELNERLNDLTSRGTPLTFTRMPMRAHIERHLMAAGFNIIDGAEAGHPGWTYAQPEERQAVMVGAGPEGGPPCVAVKSGAFPLPEWYEVAAKSLITRAIQLAAPVDTGKPWSREVFDTVYDSPVLLKVGDMVTTSIRHTTTSTD